MCLLLIAYRCHPRYVLIIGANRDEFHSRPASQASFWMEAPHVLSGRDLKAGGTWLGITRQGRLAAVTNIRRTPAPLGEGPSRGRLVSEYLLGNDPPMDYLRRVAERGHLFQPFNLVVGDPGGLAYYSNKDGRIIPLGPGLYGISNHLLNTPWPKLVRTKKALQGLMEGQDEIKPEDIFSILSDRTPASPHELPESGQDLQWELTLSSPFVVSPQYGTRSSTVILMDTEGMVLFEERNFSPRGEQEGCSRFEFRIEGLDCL